MIVSNQIESLYNGVSQQTPEHRLNTQVTEMINAVPSIENGLLKRNPTTKLSLTGTLAYQSDMWTYEYDRGAGNEKYAILISSSGMEIINAITGVVYNKANGKLIYDGASESYIIPYTNRIGYAATTVKDTTFITNKSVTPAQTTDVSPSYDYSTAGYTWIISSNAANAYTYKIVVKDDAGHSVSVSQTSTTTDGAASAIATAINNDANFSATYNGSIVKILATSGNIVSVEASDSWGNQASFGWAKEVKEATDLPLALGYDDALVKVTGTSDNAFAAYWLIYKDGQWKESLAPGINTTVDASTMPHTITRNGDDTFTIAEYTGWVDRRCGDDLTNKFPSFTDALTAIKDIFFFKNRLGFITDRTVLMSEVGEYGNFFRTTMSTVLDSDPIDVTVDTTKTISLEYVTYLEDSIMLFSDKAQFKLKGGAILGPKDVQVSQTSAYEININIRPIFMNDKVFFLGIRGNYSVLMQYYISANGATSEAIEMSSHVKQYIPADATKLSASPINNTLFITTETDADTIYSYTYMDDGNKRIQSAWYKFKFNGNIYNAFSLGKNLNIMISRRDAVAATNWVVATGTWYGSKLWDNSQVWVGSNADFTYVDQFEIMPIANQKYTDTFLDNDDTIINTNVLLGRWVLANGKSKDIRTELKFRNMLVSSEAGSDFEMYVIDNNRNDIRHIPAVYTVNRRPMVFGDAKNIEVGILSDSDKGFRINAISYEGTLVKRDRKL